MRWKFNPSRLGGNLSHRAPGQHRRDPPRSGRGCGHQVDGPSVVVSALAPLPDIRRRSCWQAFPTGSFIVDQHDQLIRQRVGRYMSFGQRILQRENAGTPGGIDVDRVRPAVPQQLIISSPPGTTFPDTFRRNGTTPESRYAQTISVKLGARMGVSRQNSAPPSRQIQRARVRR